MNKFNNIFGQILNLFPIWEFLELVKETNSAYKTKSIILLTNHLTLGATTISQIYKDRWQIELFFKAIKQNLHIKTFVSTSKSAVLTQIWTVLCRKINNMVFKNEKTCLKCLIL